MKMSGRSLIIPLLLALSLQGWAKDIPAPIGLGKEETEKFEKMSPHEKQEFVKLRARQTDNMHKFLKNLNIDKEPNYTELSKTMDIYYELVSPAEKRKIVAKLSHGETDQLPPELFKTLLERRRQKRLLLLLPDNIYFDRNLSFQQKLDKVWEKIDADQSPEGKKLKEELKKIKDTDDPKVLHGVLGTATEKIPTTLYPMDRDNAINKLINPNLEKDFDGYCKGKGAKTVKDKCQCEGVNFDRADLREEKFNEKKGFILMDNKCPDANYLDFRKKQDINSKHLNIGKDDCKGGRPLKDGDDPTFSQRHQRVRSQHGHGYCWGFSGTALLEDYYFSQTGKTIELSPLDLISKSESGTSLVSSEEGGHVKDLLEGAALFGSCEEKFAPYPQDCWEIKKYATFANVIPIKVSRTCLAMKLKKKYEKSYEKITDVTGSDCRVGVDTLLDDQKSLRNLVKEMSGIIEYLSQSKEDLQSIARKIQSSEGHFQKFIDSIIISDDCKNNNNLDVFSKIKHGGVYYSDEEKPAGIMGQAAAFMEMKKVMTDFNRPVSLFICADALEKKNSKGVVSAGCGGHFVVATNYRWNEKKNQCEVFIRNSWGEDDKAIHGWKPMTEILSSVKGTDYILP